jgi:hypothetical protein
MTDKTTEQSGAGEPVGIRATARLVKVKGDEYLASQIEQWADYIDSLRSQLDSVRKEKMDWIAANAPGGWIDDLRKKAEAAEQRARDIREECARKVAALRADWEKRLGKGGEFWDGYTSFAKACLKAIMGV